mgnify:FL=1
MFKINCVAIDHFKVPLPIVLSDSTHGEMTHFGLVTVRVTDEQGQEGLGYTYTPNNIGAAAIHKFIEQDLAEAILSSTSDSIDTFWEEMWWHVHFVGRGGLAAFAIAAVDIALWDLQAKSANKPLWRLLGGDSREVKAYAGGIDLDFTLDQLLAQADGFLAQGFQAIKMKVGRDELGQDIERVQAMRKFVGSDFPLMADANMRWPVDQAIKAASALASCSLYWLEEPVIPDDFVGHARVQAEGGVPVASGENLHSTYEFKRLIEGGGVTYPEPDAATVGGITPWLKIAELSQAHGLHITSHGIHDIHVHLLAAVTNADYLEVHGFGLERFIEEPLQLENGLALAPDRPGHGVVLDFEALETYRHAN